MGFPKFELKCSDNNSSMVTFVLKNTSSLVVSEIKIETFDLIYVDNSNQNLLTTGIDIPTSLGANESGEFTYSHFCFKNRRVGYKDFRLVFTVKDEYSNGYRCIATKNVEDNRNYNYLLGKWNTTVTLIEKKHIEDNNMHKPTVFISYNWGSDKTAELVEKRLFPIATVKRDKSSIKPWGSIREFMDTIRDTDLVVVIISDEYLKSIACLYEVMQLLKDSNWVSHSMFIVEESAKGVYNPFGQLKYIKHWSEMKQKLEEELQGFNPAAVTAQAEELKKIQLIELHINDFMKMVSDCNNPDIRMAIEEVERRVRRSSREPETEDNIQPLIPRHPVFDVKIIARNEQLPGVADVINIWRSELLPKHKNVRFQIELCNNTIIRNLKAFNRSIERGIVIQNKAYKFSVCYMESPDSKWEDFVYELSRDPYPAGEDGIPKIVPLEYVMDQKMYRQTFILSDDQVYIPNEQEEIIPVDIGKVISMKTRMRRDFLKPISELKKYSREDLWKNPENKFISDEVIIISTECKDPKWNTDGGFGKYEIYDFCDEGLLCWDNTRARIKYYHNDQLLSVSANRMLCLPYEKVVAYDLKGNSSYYMPIIHARYPIGEVPFKYYYRDIKSGEVIDNGALVEAETEA